MSLNPYPAQQDAAGTTPGWPVAPATPIAAENPSSAWSTMLADHTGALVAGVRRLAMQSDLAGMAGIAADTAAQLGHAIRARCYYFDAGQAVLWTHDGDEFSATAGLAGAAARSGQVQVAPVAHLNPRYRREIDDPAGAGAERILAQPIVTTEGEIHAVVVITRSATLAPFSNPELALLALWASQVAPLFHMLHVEGQAEQAQLDAGAIGQRGIYREEALEGLVAAEEDFGVLLDRHPGSALYPYLLVIAVVLTAGLFFALVDVREYASGPAFIVSAAHHDVAATRGGVVGSLLVAPGDAVEPGQLLATYSARAERAELVRAQAELDRALVARLRTPSDHALALTVAQAHADRQRAAARVEEASLRASVGGRVGDVRIEPGRAVQAGQVVLTIADQQEHQTVVRALVPGRHRPTLEVGQPFTLDLNGFANASQRLTVTAISEEVLGIGEIQRVVGPKIADALAIQGPVIIVEARLDAPHIEADGRTWTLHEGMIGHADVAVRSKSIAYLLFPGLEGILSDA